MAATFELLNPPTDGVSAVRFAPTAATQLLVSSWDGSVRLYDVQMNTMRSEYRHKAAVLDCCFGRDKTQAFSGGLDKAVKMFDTASGVESTLGYHEAGVRAVEFCGERGVLASGGWDRRVQLWDERCGERLVGSAAVPGKVYTMAVSGTRLVVGMAGRHVSVYDVRNMAEPEQLRESPLKFQTRCIRAYPDGSGYALSSIEGRVAMEYFDPAPEVQERKYAFKCHRVTVAGVDTVYPVNAIAFHPRHGTFATGGCDGVVNFWDGKNRKRLSQMPKFATSIASLSFNESGSLLAIAASYTFEEGEKDHPADVIHIYPVEDKDVRPKPRAAAATAAPAGAPSA